MLKVDNRVVGQTGWGPVARQCWDQTFVIPLERVRPAPGRPGCCRGAGGRPIHLHPGSPLQARELEVGVRWRDWRQLCAVAFLRLEDFLDNACHQLTLSLLPQGLLFAQVPPTPAFRSRGFPAPSEEWAVRPGGRRFPGRPETHTEPRGLCPVLTALLQGDSKQVPLSSGPQFPRCSP